ncbi:Anthranilate N-benzoyltransferase protein 3 [Platanthera guangdongensis]|uniref:Anthranilate N-benzoyltransferase protein 3 n=1 Tax=Platanthera guangdongensis TaxID=2320717 RepID=A0ABR2ME56_9ASPA
MTTGDKRDENPMKYKAKGKLCFSVAPATLRASLSAVLQEYYPLAGRLRAVGGDSEKLELDCNGEGALFVEASSAISVDQFLDGSQRPNKNSNC